MCMALRSKKKLGFIDGIIPIPEGDPDKEEECAIYGTVRSHMIQQEPIPKLRTVLAQICKEEQHKNSTRIGDSLATAPLSRDRRNFSSKFYCTYCKQARHNVIGRFQLVGYPKWWPQNSHHLATGRDLSPSNNNKAWCGDRSGRGARQEPQPPRDSATDGGRPLEAWANSASVRQGRSAAPDIFSRDNLLTREEDSCGPSGPMHSDGPSDGPSTSSSGPSPFPALTVDQW
ncbi:hypothetical protein M9H77_34205 [Catharanthus roseus]|uniref:Uncharacterized protein n=1 Tax=Catharanthus roseus TaxID=4058 RepID=A0ACB9ZKT2_CATRO|nr:hypothetical protein M9H77_34205 [Catharanthus roseus]